MDKMQETLQKENDKTKPEARHALYVDPRLVQSLDVNNTTEGTVHTSTKAHQHSLQKRARTAGEKIFDWSTYGGLAFLANEIVSGKIQNYVLKQGQWATRDATIGHKTYQSLVSGLHRLVGKDPSPEHWLGAIRRPIDIFVMTLGGSLMVLPVKFLEDRKSALVRFYDKTFHPDQTKNNTSITLAHEQMDREPKQSWWSLWKARLVVIPAAIVADALIGSKDAFSTKLFDKGNNWSSMHRINVQLTRKIAGFFGKPEIKSAILNNAKHPEYKYEIQNNEGNLAHIGKTYGFLLILSAALAAGFYVSSRIFARRREEHKFYQQMHTTQPAPVMAETESTPPALEAETTTTRADAKTPSPQIHDAVALARVAQPNSLSAGAA
jgi:hypothetical protein